MPLKYTRRHSFSHGTVASLTLTDDRRLVARAGIGPGLSVFEEQEAGLKKLKELKSETSRCAFSPDGRFLAMGSKTVKVLETRKFKTVATIKVSRREPIKALAWSPDSSRLAMAAETRRHKSTVVIWEQATCAERRIESEDFGDGYFSPSIFASLAFLPDNQTLVSASWGSERGVMTHNLATGAKQHPPVRFLHQARRAQPLPDGSAVLASVTMAQGEGDAMIKDRRCWFIRWTLADNAIQTIPTPDGYWINNFTLHPDGEHVALRVTDKEKYEGESGMVEDHTVLMMSLADGSTTRIVGADELMEQRIGAVEFSPDGQRLAVAGQYDTTLIYHRE